MPVLGCRSLTMGNRCVPQLRPGFVSLITAKPETVAALCGPKTTMRVAWVA